MKRSRMLSRLAGYLCVLLAMGFAPAAAPQALDSWAPQGSQPPIGLIVNDPVRGVIPFPPVHATLLPDGRVMSSSQGSSLP